MYYAYVLESERMPREHYRGHTSDLSARLIDHNSGKVPATRALRPWRIKFYAAFETLDLARAFEQYLKSGSGHAFGKRRLGL